MSQPALVLDEVVSRVSDRTVEGGEGTRIEPILDPQSGQPEGMVMESLLERVAIFVRAQDSLSLDDISHVRRSMARAHARRADVYVLTKTNVQKPIMLLATLSKIRIVRVDRPESVL